MLAGFQSEPCLRNNAVMTELAALKIFSSPIGRIAVGSTEVGVATLEILIAGQSKAEFSNSPKAHKITLDAIDRLGSYFDGSTKSLEIETDLAGTEFQRAVWDAIAKLEFGQITTYAEIAQSIGNAKAVRAVGGAVGANPVPLIIGCHRVLGSNRKITGYSGGEGIPTKRWLLEHEQISYVQ